MKTRKAHNPKSPSPATKTPPPPPDASAQSPPAPTPMPKRASSITGKTLAKNVATSATPETPDAGEAIKAHDDTVKATTRTKSRAKKTVKKVVKKTIIRRKLKASDAQKQPDSVTVKKDVREVPAEKENLEEVKDVGLSKQEESVPSDDESISLKDDKNVAEAEDMIKVMEVPPFDEDEELEDDEKEPMETHEKLSEVQEPSFEKEVVNEKENKETIIENEKEEQKEKKEPYVEIMVKNQDFAMEKGKDVGLDELRMEINEEEKDMNSELKGVDDPQERLCLSDEERDNDIGNDEDEVAVTDAKVAEPSEVNYDDKHVAEEWRRRKEFEIFVGGLDHDTTEEEVKKVFKNAGEVVEVRMHKEVSNNKNKGYAFVRFAEKEHVAYALSEMKNPVIHGKRCGTAPSDDNDTLYVGNICNRWTKEAIKQKLQDYGIKGVERITLISDPHHKGLSRGFAFIEFTDHPDAMQAFKRLQKPDVILGHPERTAKVAFAEPLREPAPEVLAQIKSVFIDGLLPYWDEDTVRAHLKGYGTIERITLSHNMSTAKMKYFGFVDFTTHESALACIDGVNKKELGDGKMKVRARLLNPLPKTQAVKGGIAGGFRIGQGSGSGATFSRTGRGYGRGAHAPNRMNFEGGGRGVYQHRSSQSQPSRMGYGEDYLPAGPPHPYYRERWDDFHRHRHGGVMDHNHHPPMPLPMRGPAYFPEEEFSRPYGGRRYDDPYSYGDPPRGVKRPYFAEQDPEYMESSRSQPRLDYSYQGGGSGGHSRDYYNYDYDRTYSSYYGDYGLYGRRYD